MKAIIIDDEAHARQTIRMIVESRFSELEILGEAGSVAEGLDRISILQPDLLFLDIDLPDGTGFDLLGRINYRKLKVIFITAYQEFALQAIKFSAYDYILKPVNPLELFQTLRKVLDEQAEAIENEMQFKAILSNLQNSDNALKKIVLKTAEMVFVKEVSEIIRCESDNVYTTFFDTKGKKILVSKSIKSFEEMLEGQGFMRVHQSHLINLNHINCYDKQEGGMLIMSDDSRVPVSLKKKPILLDYLNRL